MFRIPVVDVYVTGACNLRCPYCFGEIDSKSGMPTATYRQALSFARFTSATVVELCGGEPLLYTKLKWAVESARAEGFELILRTNGYRVSEMRSFIAENFQAVGISLDGDVEGNNRMRPHKGHRDVSAEAKFEVPLQEIVALKTLNPKLSVILASVATAENVDSILALGRILVRRKLPLDLWKIYQFVANKFRAAINQDRFMLSAEKFASLQGEIETLIGGKFPTSCRKSDEIDGSCLVINRDGDVLLGAHRFGSVVRDSFEDICNRLDSADAAARISANKFSTYPTLIPAQAK